MNIFGLGKKAPAEYVQLTKDAAKEPQLTREQQAAFVKKANEFLDKVEQAKIELTPASLIKAEGLSAQQKILSLLTAINRYTCVTVEDFAKGSGKVLLKLAKREVTFHTPAEMPLETFRVVSSLVPDRFGLASSYNPYSVFCCTVEGARDTAGHYLTNTARETRVSPWHWFDVAHLQRFKEAFEDYARKQGLPSKDDVVAYKTFCGAEKHLLAVLEAVTKAYDQAKAREPSPVRRKEDTLRAALAELSGKNPCGFLFAEPAARPPSQAAVEPASPAAPLAPSKPVSRS